MRYVTLGEVVELHRRLLQATGGAFGIRDFGALKSLPLCRTREKPARSRARIASAAVTRGSLPVTPQLRER